MRLVAVANRVGRWQMGGVSARSEVEAVTVELTARGVKPGPWRWDWRLAAAGYEEQAENEGDRHSRASFKKANSHILTFRENMYLTFETEDHSLFPQAIAGISKAHHQTRDSNICRTKPDFARPKAREIGYMRGSTKARRTVLIFMELMEDKDEESVFMNAIDKEIIISKFLQAEPAL
ncbi:glutamyl-tRNA(Gln) amidotransferase subunit A [Striga asiatica]|uniref:Glutamyl-tRNA(Gln) amidotransferase subunit A n=1 Tax=Striga asiatica TaxID=4170 RepID=A0A5A7RJ13_STRAF|nr:glutamyl-tRNA(Gln) amidotransferase subunit A [Striga asiatica]